MFELSNRRGKDEVASHSLLLMGCLCFTGSESTNVGGGPDLSHTVTHLHS